MESNGRFLRSLSFELWALEVVLTVKNANLVISLFVLRAECGI